jgi:hypothetical protein
MSDAIEICNESIAVSSPDGAHHNTPVAHAGGHSPARGRSPPPGNPFPQAAPVSHFGCSICIRYDFYARAHPLQSVIRSRTASH